MSFWNEYVTIEKFVTSRMKKAKITHVVTFACIMSLCKEHGECDTRKLPKCVINLEKHVKPLLDSGLLKTGAGHYFVEVTKYPNEGVNNYVDSNKNLDVIKKMIQEALKEELNNMPEVRDDAVFTSKPTYNTPIGEDTVGKENKINDLHGMCE